MTSITPLNHIIPMDVMYNILASLPAKTLLRFKCVCKDWYTLINDPVFIKHNLNKSLETDFYHHHLPFVFTSSDDYSLYFGDDIDSPSQALVKFNWRDNIILEHEHVGFIGSSNGLVCLCKGDKGFIICNPLTRKFKQVLCPPEIIRSSLEWLGLFGFGYDSQHDDYKVVVLKLQDDKETWVYSLKTDSWRKAPPQYQSPLHKKVYKPLCSSVFGHGMIHCILRGVDDYSQVYPDPDYTDDEQPQIARFNLSSEEWEDDDLGYPTIDPSSVYSASLTFLDGCFCVSASTSEFSLEIWIMKEYGIKESWTKLLHIPHDPSKLFNLGKPIAYSRTTQTMWLNSINEDYAGIVCYDMQHETREAFKFSIPKKCYEVTVHLCAPSLVSIPGSSNMQGQIHQAEEEENTTVSPSATQPVKKEKKKEKKLLYYSWSRTSM